MAMNTLHDGFSEKGALIERHFQALTARRRVYTGLGLAIVKHIVERHRGKLDIASTPGHGTTVTIRLRMATNAPP